MDVQFEVDTRDFERALRKTLEQTSRDIPAVINSSAIDIITTAAKYTKKADKTHIEDSLAALVPANTVVRSGQRPRAPRASPVRRIYLMLNSKQRKAGKPGLNNSDMARQVKAFIRRRSAAIGFVAYAGWQNALLAFGGRGFGSKKGKANFGPSTADRGRGVKAVKGRLSALMTNTAAACEKYGRLPLEMAFQDKTRRMLEHLEAKLKQRCDEANRS